MSMGFGGTGNPVSLRQMIIPIQDAIPEHNP